jgi:glycosyltransferase involved in cell wall biosynthesis
LVFNPGFGVLGGGERYAFALGEVIGESHEVVYATNRRVPDQTELLRFGLPQVPISSLDLDDLPVASAEYDLAVAVTSHPLPPLHAAHNLLVVQFPFSSLSTNPVSRWRTVRRLRRCDRVVYSRFAKRWIAERWAVDASVLAPPVVIPAADVPKKENLILSVGRFFPDAHCKRQDVLVEAFARLPDEVKRTWTLALVGGYRDSPENADFVRHVRGAASGMNVLVELNAPATRVFELRDRARFYWHATGFGRRADEPERAEHFGLSTLEAMSHGAIPLVFADGGQPEVVPLEVGVLWESIPELVDRTVGLMARPWEELDAVGLAARDASRTFSRERFDVEARRIIARCTSNRPLPRTARRAQAIATQEGRRVWSVVRDHRSRRGEGD